MDGTVSTLPLEWYESTEKRGFLPTEDLAWSFGDDANPGLKDLKSLGEQLPGLLERHELRKTVDSMKRVEEGTFGGLDGLIQFRRKRLESALNYIFTKADDPSCTGGTPFIRRLARPKDETAQKVAKKGMS